MFTAILGEEAITGAQLFKSSMIRFFIFLFNFDFDIDFDLDQFFKM